MRRKDRCWPGFLSSVNKTSSGPGNTNYNLIRIANRLIVNINVHI